MPKSKTPDAAPEALTGFAALEAKVEEIQAQTHDETGQTDADSAMPTLQDEPFLSAGAPEAPSIPTPWDLGTSSDLAADGGAPIEAPVAASGMTVLSAFQETIGDAMRFQVETFTRFAQVRGPQDLLSAQLAYGQRVMELQTSIWSRVAKASARAL